MSTFYGSDLAQFPDQISFDPRSGMTVRRPWRGTPTKIVEKINELLAAGVKFDHEPGTSGGYQWVFALYQLLPGGGSSTTTPITDIWSLPGNDLEKDIWRHPKVKALFSEFLDSNGDPKLDGSFFSHRRQIEDLASGEASVNDKDIAAWWNSANSAKKKFVRNLSRGETSFVIDQYVLRNEKTVANDYVSFTDGAIPAYAHRGKILTTNELQVGFGVPTVLRFAMPAGFWLQKTPSVLPGRLDQWVITQEWLHTDDYDDFLYDRI